MGYLIPAARAARNGKRPDASQDLQLWAGFRTGSTDALAQLYRNHLAALRRHGLGVCRDSGLIDDAIHELFSRLWCHRERIGPAQNVRSYLFRSLERIVIAQLIKQRKWSGWAPAGDLQSDSFEQLWIDKEIQREKLNEVRKCLQDLPKCQREVILLKFFNDLSYGEISEIMEMQVASVYNLTSKAIEHLRQTIQTLHPSVS